MKANVIDGRVEFFEQPLAAPLQLSSGEITRLTEARVTVRLSVAGRVAAGSGSIYLSDLWAWPAPTLSHEIRDQSLRGFCLRLARDLPALCGGEALHPLELGLRLHHSADELRDAEFRPIPRLARAMAMSPFDAAIHDAAGLALGRSAFSFYDEPEPIPSADLLFTEEGGACRAIGAMLARPPRRELKAWVIVNKNDDLPNALLPWVVKRGYRGLKLKLMGKDPAADVERTVRTWRAALSLGAANVVLSADSNEANPDARSVREYLDRLREADRGAFDALAYLEQPTARDIRAAPFDWRDVARIKPVMLDEGLSDLEVMEEAARQGWSGWALKTCKGHSFALVGAAWAWRRKMLLTLQDLTNPGFSLIHAALFAAHVPTLNGVELNSPQFTPAANAAWLPRCRGLFEPQDGCHRLPDMVPFGLGSSL